MGVAGDESRPLRALVLYTKSTEEVFNRKSALGSYINCLCELLTEKFMDVSINGRPFNHLNEQRNISELTTSTRWPKLAGKFPKVFSQVLRDLIIF